MTRLCELNDTELLSRLERWNGKEHSATLLVVKYLSEVDLRRLYLGLGFSSLFAFCTIRLHYSESSAQRRIVAARCIRDFPEVYEALKAKQVSLVTTAIFSKVLTKANVTEVLRAVSFKGKDKVETYVSELFDVPAPVKEVIRTIRVQKPKELPLLSQAKSKVELSEASILEPATPSEPEALLKYKLGFYVDKQTMDKLNRLKELKPFRTLEELFDALLSDYLKKNDPKNKESKTATSRPKSRHIPTALRAFILRRDDHQCSYVATDGTRCLARHNLQIDHIVPFSIGGETTESNLRTLCASHNQFEAKKVLGEEVMARFTQ